MPAIGSIGFAGISFGSVAALGAAVAMGGVAQMLSPAPTLAGGSASVDTKASFLFGSADNVTAQGVPVPVVFGEFVVGSVVISVGLSTEELGTDPAVSIFTFSSDPSGRATMMATAGEC